MDKKRTITRTQYKSMKRLDHKQMEEFIQNLYLEGYEDGQKIAKQKVKPSDIAVTLMEIKGVGTKKVEEIMIAINKLYERSEKNVI
jgi:hypothetical protein